MISMKFIQQFAILLMMIVTISSAFLLPPPKIQIGQLKEQNKFKDGLVSCGNTFCSPDNCNHYCDENGKTIYECAE